MLAAVATGYKMSGGNKEPVSTERYHVLWGGIDSSDNQSDSGVESSSPECETVQGGDMRRKFLRKKLQQRFIDPDEITFSDISSDEMEYASSNNALTLQEPNFQTAQEDDAIMTTKLKRHRPCKGKRQCFNKVLKKLSPMVDDNPEILAGNITLDLPACIKSDGQAYAKLLQRLRQHAGLEPPPPEPSFKQAPPGSRKNKQNTKKEASVLSPDAPSDTNPSAINDLFFRQAGQLSYGHARELVPFSFSV